MASVSVSHMILFIASMLIAASVAGVFTSSVGRLSEAIEDQGLQISDDVRTDIEIISDNGTGACVFNCDGNDNLTLHIKNTGSQELPTETDNLNIFVDGEFQPPSNVTMTVLGDATAWRRDEVVRVEIEGLSPTQGDHRVKVVVNREEEVFTFRIP